MSSSSVAGLPKVGEPGAGTRSCSTVPTGRSTFPASVRGRGSRRVHGPLGDRCPVRGLCEGLRSADRVGGRRSASHASNRRPLRIGHELRRGSRACGRRRHRCDQRRHRPRKSAPTGPSSDAHRSVPQPWCASGGPRARRWLGPVGLPGRRGSRRGGSLGLPRHGFMRLGPAALSRQGQCQVATRDGRLRPDCRGTGPRSPAGLSANADRSRAGARHQSAHAHRIRHLADRPFGQPETASVSCSRTTSN